MTLRIASFCAALALAACSNTMTRRAPPPATPEVRDSVLVARVNHALMAAGIDGYSGLQIHADEGTDVLTGELATRDLVQRAADAAHEVDGVDRVLCCVTPADGLAESR